MVRNGEMVKVNMEDRRTEEVKSKALEFKLEPKSLIAARAELPRLCPDYHPSLPSFQPGLSPSCSDQLEKDMDPFGISLLPELLRDCAAPFVR